MPQPDKTAQPRPLEHIAHWLGGAALLITCELAGRTLAAQLPFAVPGPVIGMLLLLLGLMLYGKVPHGLALVSEQLLRMLVLIFLPAAVGIYFLRELPASDWFALLAAMVVGTLISLYVSALLLNSLLQRSRGFASPPSQSQSQSQSPEGDDGE